MPNPKRRHSRARGRLRRTHYKVKSLNLSKCPNCNQPKLPHLACPNCGFYNKRKVYQPKES
jgi:large subunit ribosomal protein L32